MDGLQLTAPPQGQPLLQPPPQPPPQNMAIPTQPRHISADLVNQSSTQYYPSLVADGRVQNASQNAFINHKSLLQQYAQKARLALPSYTVVNEGYPHAPQFRATVSVNGTQFTSPNTFAQRKAAEQDAARVAMENMTPIENKEVELFNIHEDKTFCKSILNELVMKINPNMENPSYSTVQPNVSVPAFRSTVVFNGFSYTGEVGRNKREAEQLAARAVIVSLLESEFKPILSEIIQSKGKLYASIYEDNSHSSTGQMPIGVKTEMGAIMENNTATPQSSIVQDTTTQVAQPPHHVFKKPGLEHSEPADSSSPLATNPPITSLPPSVLPRSVVFVPPQMEGNMQRTGKKKRKRNSKNKAMNHVQLGAQVPFVMVNPSQVTCSTAL